MKTLINRWVSETPSFFKKIIGIGIAIGGAGGLILALPATLPTIVLPAYIITIANNMVVTGGVAAIVAKFAKVDIPKE